MRRADGLVPRMSPSVDTRPGSSSTEITIGRRAWPRMPLTSRMSWARDSTLPGLRKIPPTPMSSTFLMIGSDGSLTSGMPTISVRAARWASGAGVQSGTAAERAAVVVGRVVVAAGDGGPGSPLGRRRTRVRADGGGPIGGGPDGGGRGGVELVRGRRGGRRGGDPHHDAGEGDAASIMTTSMRARMRSCTGRGRYTHRSRRSPEKPVTRRRPTPRAPAAGTRTRRPARRRRRPGAGGRRRRPGPSDSSTARATASLSWASSRRRRSRASRATSANRRADSSWRRRAATVASSSGRPGDWRSSSSWVASSAAIESSSSSRTAASRLLPRWAIFHEASTATLTWADDLRQTVPQRTGPGALAPSP